MKTQDWHMHIFVFICLFLSAGFYLGFITHKSYTYKLWIQSDTDKVALHIYKTVGNPLTCKI